MEELDDDLEVESEMDVYYFANACHVCRAYGKDVRLKRCAKCKSIAYCNREHQKEHWPRHKSLCRVLSEIVECAGSVYGIHRTWENNEEAWSKMKTNLVLLIQLKLGRKFLPFEREMLQFPRSCEICHETDPSKLTDCTDCPDASFCPRHSKDSRHSKKCKESRLCFETSIQVVGLEKRKFTINCPEKLPENMDQVIRLHESLNQYHNFHHSRRIWNIILSNLLSRPYTFFYSLEKLQQTKLTKMTIHVIGATMEEFGDVSDWECLFHHKNSLLELLIVFVGPEMWTGPPYNMSLCENCTKNNRKLYSQTVQGLYKEFAEEVWTGSKFTKPDFAIGYNLGIHECVTIENDTWSSTIQKLADLECPFAFTSYTAKESTADRKRINLIRQKKVPFLYAGKNPFSGWKPYKDFESESYFYKNQFLTIYEKL